MLSSLSLLPDESLSSWKRRNPDAYKALEMTFLFHGDSDFGQLQLKQPLITNELFVQLQEAAKPPDPWLLNSDNKQYCPRCWAEDWASGQQVYARRAWRVAWRTCCPKHGLYRPVDSVTREYLRVPLRGIACPRWNDLDAIHFNPRRVVNLNHFGGLGWESLKVQEWVNSQAGEELYLVVIGRRGMHLQGALEVSSLDSKWCPKGLEPTLLRCAYALIVKELMKQFSLDITPLTIGGKPKFPVYQRRANRFKSDVWRDLGLFYRLGPVTRFSINVLTEAVLSSWTVSPLPGDAGPHRYTQNLVKAIGWESGLPKTAHDLLPLESLVKRVHADLFMKEREAQNRAKQTNAMTSPCLEFAPASVAEQEDAHRMRIQTMSRFYRGSHTIDSLVSRAYAKMRRECQELRMGLESAVEKPIKVNAGRDPREMDTN